MKNSNKVILAYSRDNYDDKTAIYGEIGKLYTVDYFGESHIIKIISAYNCLIVASTKKHWIGKIWGLGGSMTNIKEY